MITLAREMLVAKSARLMGRAATPIRTCRRNASPWQAPSQGVCNGPDECRAAVRYQIKAPT